MAFVIAIHHYFEQQIVERLPKQKYNQERAFYWLKERGWKPREIELNELRLAANCAKHSTGNSSNLLYGLRPDMFDASKIKIGFEPSYDNLALSDAHVEAFFHALMQSVPSNLGMRI
jgi:hypothetical protein